uniref:Putative ovule protein n=1 Tax=Solanum chacoense TaxID=4108 RepID=A0A0V0GYW9_SOLCH
MCSRGTLSLRTWLGAVTPSKPFELSLPCESSLSNLTVLPSPAPSNPVPPFSILLPVSRPTNKLSSLVMTPTFLYPPPSLICTPNVANLLMQESCLIKFLKRMLFHGPP